MLCKSKLLNTCIIKKKINRKILTSILKTLVKNENI